MNYYQIGLSNKDFSIIYEWLQNGGRKEKN